MSPAGLSEISPLVRIVGEGADFGEDDDGQPIPPSDRGRLNLRPRFEDMVSVI